MTTDELTALAGRVKDGKASAEESKLFANEFNKKVADLNNYLDSLPKKDDA